MKNDPEIRIGGRSIGATHPPYVIAELSANHNGSMDAALRLVTEAKRAGADAVKLQTYRADTITLDCDSEDFRIRGGLWDGQTLYQLYTKAHTPWEWHAPLFEHAHRLGITIFSSPFDHSAVDLLEELGAPAYKIASFEVTDHELIRYVAATGKPMIISTGMANAEEIEEAIAAAREGGATDLAILHCVSGYPAPAGDYNLRTIGDMISRYGLVTGLSDHSVGQTAAIASIALGASVIEKHFTLNRDGGGPDDSFSVEPGEMAELCRMAHSAWTALGVVDYSLKPSELPNVKFRRSLYFVKEIRKGEVISREAVRSVRPGYGLSPKYLEKILGMRALRDIKPNTPVRLDLLGRS